MFPTLDKIKCKIAHDYTSNLQIPVFLKSQILSIQPMKLILCLKNIIFIVQMVILFNKWLSVLVFTAFFSYNTPIPAFSGMHPYHVSATEIEWNVKESRLEISSKLFTDDFEAVLAKLYKTKTDFADKSMKVQMDELVKKYITSHLSVRNNGKLLPLQLFGWQLDKEVVYVYATASARDFNPKNITVENTILYDLFTDQMNIVHFLVVGDRKSTKLNYPDRKAQFSF